MPGTYLQRPKYLHLLAIASLFVLFALLILGNDWVSLTADEPTYVALGYGLLARSQEIFPILTQRGYPPLLISLEAAPIYLANPHIPVESLPGWANDYALYIQAFEPYLLATLPTKLLIRLPIICLTMLLGAIVFRWGKELFGIQSGFAALGVLLFDPLLLAHGQLANSDVGTVALGTIALYLIWQWRQKAEMRWAVAGGVLLGLTLSAKVSGVLWAIASGLIIVSTLVQQRSIRKIFQVGSQGALISLLSIFILWAGYRFEWRPIHNFPWQISLPATTYWESLLYFDQYIDSYFALGLRQPGGWWWYFPLAFLIKNPLPLLISFIIVFKAFWKHWASWENFLILGFFPLLYIGIAIREGINVGYRYILPIHPFIYLIIGSGLTSWLAEKKNSAFRKGTVGLLSTWYVIGTISIFPNQIAFFNELVGGPNGGYRYLADSNVDWGQTREIYKSYVAANPQVKTQPPVAKLYPPTGQYLIGASYLQGMGIGEPDAYEWFRHREPNRIIAQNLLIYDIPPRELNWVAQCTKPVVPLNDLALTQGIGQANLRKLYFDCTRSWIFPAGNNTPGIYALHHDLFQGGGICLPTFLACAPTPLDSFITRHLTSARFSFEQPYTGSLPALVLYESNLSELPKLTTPQIFMFGAGEQLSSKSLTLPISWNGPLSLIGVVFYTHEQTLEIETWWRVVANPAQRPFSIMAHLISSNGETVEAMDGLGISQETLLINDVIVQRHFFTKDSLRAASAVIAGAYWLDTLERWNTTINPTADSIRIEFPK